MEPEESLYVAFSRVAEGKPGSLNEDSWGLRGRMLLDNDWGGKTAVEVMQPCETRSQAVLYCTASCHGLQVTYSQSSVLVSLWLAMHSIKPDTRPGSCLVLCYSTSQSLLIVIAEYFHIETTIELH